MRNTYFQYNHEKWLISYTSLKKHQSIHKCSKFNKSGAFSIKSRQENSLIFIPNKIKLCYSIISLSHTTQHNNVNQNSRFVLFNICLTQCKCFKYLTFSIILIRSMKFCGEQLGHRWSRISTEHFLTLTSSSMSTWHKYGWTTVVTRSSCRT